MLNPDLEREEETKFELGSSAHSLFLQGDDIIEQLPYPDWRTAQAREHRDAARAEGRIPLFADQATRVRAMVAAANAQLRDHDAQPPLFADGPKQTLIWEDDHGVIRRARLDWLRDDFAAIDDLKTTSASADPVKWTRTMYGMGADIQIGFYCRGVEKLTGVRPVFRYCVVETYPPHALSVVDLAPSALALAEEKVQAAIDLWAPCLAHDIWPGFETRVASIEVPTYEEMRWMKKQEAVASSDLAFYMQDGLSAPWA